MWPNQSWEASDRRRIKVIFVVLWVFVGQVGWLGSLRMKPATQPVGVGSDGLRPVTDPSKVSARTWRAGSDQVGQFRQVFDLHGHPYLEWYTWFSKKEKKRKKKKNNTLRLRALLLRKNFIPSLILIKYWMDELWWGSYYSLEPKTMALAAKMPKVFFFFFFILVELQTYLCYFQIRSWS